MSMLYPPLLHPSCSKLSKGTKTSPHIYVSKLIEKINSNQPPFSNDKNKTSHQVLTDVIVTSDGDFYERGETKGRYLSSTGACHRANNTRPQCSTEIKNIKTYNRIITLACYWGDQTWHFPMESLVGLFSVPREIIEDNSVKIHITRITNYTTQWLSLMNIPQSRVIDGNIEADIVYSPLLGGCGEPYVFQIRLLRETLAQRLVRTRTKHTDPEISKAQKRLIVYVKRTKARGIVNDSQLEGLVRLYAAQRHYRIHIHNDTNLPPLAEQMEIFSQADIVISPHGGTSVLTPVMKSGSSYIELMEIGSAFENLCGARLSYFCGVRHCIVPSVNLKVNPNHLIQALTKLN